jgi:hypothetical protein
MLNLHKLKIWYGWYHSLKTATKTKAEETLDLYS